MYTITTGCLFAQSRGVVKTKSCPVQKPSLKMATPYETCPLHPNYYRLSGKDIIVYDSDSFVSSFIQHGLTDEFYLLLNPVAIGSRQPIFNPIKNNLQSSAANHPYCILPVRVFIIKDRHTRILLYKIKSTCPQF